MAVVTVHSFKVWDFPNSKWVYPAHKRTAEGIKAVRAKRIEGSAEEVSETDIDGQWLYIPKEEAVNAQRPQRTEAIVMTSKFLKYKKD